MKVLIGYPPTNDEVKGTALLSQNRQFQYFENPTFLFPVVLGTAATMVRDIGHNVLWEDAIAQDLSVEEYETIISSEKPDIFFFETKAPVIKKHWDIVKQFKNKFPLLKIVMCGDHVSYKPLETMEKCPVDFVINGGYFDFAFMELLNAIEFDTPIPYGVWYRNKGKVIDNGRYIFKSTLDNCPVIDRVLTKNDNYQKEFNLKGRPLAYIMSGRDCWWGKCTFCVWDHALYPRGTFKGRSPQHVLEEVKYLVDNQGVREIFDDCGTITVGSWLEKFCKLMIESGYNKKVMYSCNMRFGAVNSAQYKLMKEAGFRLLKFGLESGCQKTIDKLDKGTKIEKVIPSCKEAKEAGLTVHITMMVGYPWETKEDAMETFTLVNTLMSNGYADIHQSTVIVPYPGTPLYEEGKLKRWFRFDPEQYERFDMTEPVFKTPDMTPEEVVGMCYQNYKAYLNPLYIVQHAFKRIRSWEDVVYSFKGLNAVLGHFSDFSRTIPQAEFDGYITEEQLKNIEITNPRQDLVYETGYLKDLKKLTPLAN